MDGFFIFCFVQIIISTLGILNRFDTCLLPIEPYPMRAIFKQMIFFNKEY